MGNLDNFSVFIKELELAEVSYENTPSQKSLLNILITLIAPQTEIQTGLLKVKQGIKQLDSALGKRTFSFKRMMVNLGTLRGNITPIRKVAVKLQTLLKSYDALLGSFNTILMDEKMETTPNLDTGTPTVGSLAHFAMVSHSVSRQKLYDEVLKELTTQINSPRKAKV